MLGHARLKGFRARGYGRPSVWRAPNLFWNAFGDSAGDALKLREKQAWLFGCIGTQFIITSETTWCIFTIIAKAMMVGDGVGGYIDHRPVGNPKRKV
jgi:hypothetical protein